MISPGSARTFNTGNNNHIFIEKKVFHLFYQKNIVPRSKTSELYNKSVLQFPLDLFLLPNPEPFNTITSLSVGSSDIKWFQCLLKILEKSGHPGSILRTLTKVCGSKKLLHGTHTFLLLVLTLSFVLFKWQWIFLVAWKKYFSLNFSITSFSLLIADNRSLRKSLRTWRCLQSFSPLIPNLSH